MLAGRRLLDRNARLGDWARRTWHGWLEDRRETAPNMAQPLVVAVATLTCLEDLYLHMGLLQLLATPGLRCTPVFRLPTDAAARLMRAKARREEWESLVHIISDAECELAVMGLPAGTKTIDFSLPAILPSQEAAAPSEARQAARSEGVEDFLSSVFSQDPDQVPALEAPPSMPPRDVRQLRAEVRLEGLDLEFPEVGGGDELVVRAAAGQGIKSRLLTGLEGAEPRIRIRVPTSLLTTEPRDLRLECYKPDGRVPGFGFQIHVPPSRLQPWMVAAFLNRGGAGNPVIRAFAGAIGCRIGYAEDEPQTLADIPVVWGVLRDSDRILSQAKKQGLYFFYIDHAYFNRGHGRTYRITRNGYEAGPTRHFPDDRLSALELDVRPWRKSGDEIIVCPPTEFFMEAHGCHDWLDSTMAELRSVTDRPITVRTKPRPGEAVVPLQDALRSAHALVTHSSNVAIEAVCLGTPVFVAPMSAAAPVGKTNLSEIENPVYPDRGPWLSHLAYNQFSFDEIADGSAWRMLLELEQRDLA
jgi:hypothetical protein